MKNNRKSSKSESGQALIIITFAIIGLIALTGLTVDGGLAYSDRRNAQNAADTAALAGARAQIHMGDVKDVAQSIATANGYNNNGTSNVVKIESKFMAYTAGVCPGTYHDITVEITSHLKTTFSTVIGVREVTNKVIAKSRVCDVSGEASTEPLYSGSSIYATNPIDDCKGKKGKDVFINGNSGSIQLWGGGFGSAGTDSTCMDFQNGITSLKLSEVEPKTCATLQSAASSSTGATFNGFEGSEGACKPGGKPIINYGVKFTDPPDLNITCDTDATKSGNKLNPGNWPGSTGATGDFPQSGVKILSPGTYCVTGAFDKGRTLTGTGVTIVLKNGSFDLTGGNLTLTAPTSGTYKGLVIYMPPTNTSTVNWRGGAKIDITGTMLMQSATCTIEGGAQVQKQPWQMICSTWARTGTADIQGKYDPTKFFIAPPTLVNPTIMLLQ